MSTKHARLMSGMLGGAVLAACGVGLSACGGGTSSPTTPVAALSSSRAAQEAFRPLRQRWIGAIEAAERNRLEPNLAWFVAHYPKDGFAPLARVYLAIIALDQGRLAKAQALIGPVLDGPPGPAHDLADVAYAILLDRGGSPAKALERLELLVGKIIDPYARTLFDEELVRAALNARHWYEAVAYMDVWLRDAAEEDLEVVRGHVDAALAKVPAEALELMFQTMNLGNPRAGGSGDGTGYGDLIRKAVGGRLATVALHDRDPKLAQRLLDRGAGSSTLADSSEDLRELAAIGGVARVEGRTVGLLVSVHGDRDRTRSGDALAGMMDGLGLLDAGASAPAAESNGAAAPRLTTRQEHDRKYVESAVQALATQGASLLVVALDAEQTTVALHAAERLGVATIALGPSEAPLGNSGFSLGEDDAGVAAALLAWLTEHGGNRSVIVSDEQAPLTHASGSAALAPVPCRSQSAQVSEPRFPVEAWRTSHVDGLLLLGDLGCARDVIDATLAGKLRARAALGLAAAELASEVERVPLITARAGVFPWFRQDLKSPLEAFEARHGAPPSWYAVLGHDAAVLARAALATLPNDTTEDAKEVARRRSAVRSALEKTDDLPLWSTEAKGFRGEHRLKRTLSVLQVR